MVVLVEILGRIAGMRDRWIGRKKSGLPCSTLRMILCELLFLGAQHMISQEPLTRNLLLKALCPSSLDSTTSNAVLMLSKVSFGTRQRTIANFVRNLGLGSGICYVSSRSSFALPHLKVTHSSSLPSTASPQPTSTRREDQWPKSNSMPKSFIDVQRDFSPS